jgi:hypothetical protein
MLATRWTVSVDGLKYTELDFLENDDNAKKVAKCLTDHRLSYTREGNRLAIREYWRDVFALLVDFDG